MSFRSLPLIAAAMLAWSTAAIAHHSFGLYDAARSETLNGTVRQFDFKNPHSYLWLVVAGAAGQQVVWGVEMAAPGLLLTQGVKRDTFQPGDKVTIDVHPLTDGRPGGLLVKATLANGKTLLREYSAPKP